jgi:hypothetical protein
MMDGDKKEAWQGNREDALVGLGTKSNAAALGASLTCIRWAACDTCPTEVAPQINSLQRHPQAGWCLHHLHL